jgi:8-oxo-dGTP pyrophosphatase MutT (NUDIX family)
MEPKLFVATKAFIVHQGKVLILRESGTYDEGTNSGRYDLPGGRLQPGEHVLEALKREVKEETGLVVELGDPISVGEWRPVVKEVPWQIIGIFFECETSSLEVSLSGDHDEYKWIEPSEYQKYNLIENLKPVFQKYLKK